MRFPNNRKINPANPSQQNFSSQVTQSSFRNLFSRAGQALLFSVGLTGSLVVERWQFIIALLVSGLIFGCGGAGNSNVSSSVSITTQLVVSGLSAPLGLEQPNDGTG